MPSLKHALQDFLQNNNYIQAVRYSIKGLSLYLTGSPSTRPWMEDAEREAFYAALADTSVLLEFGSGGSTWYAVTHGIRVFSVESSLWFMRLMKKAPAIRQAIKQNRLRYYHANTGITKEWSYPIFPVDGALYWQKPLMDIPREDTELSRHFWSQIDTVFIDGRYRVACALNALKALPNIKKIIIHDYMDRPHYHVLETLLTRQTSAGTLAIFSHKKDSTHTHTHTDREQLEAMLAQYAQDAR